MLSGRFEVHAAVVLQLRAWQASEAALLFLHQVAQICCLLMTGGVVRLVAHLMPTDTFNKRRASFSCYYQHQQRSCMRTMAMPWPMLVTVVVCCGRHQFLGTIFMVPIFYGAYIINIILF